MLKVGDVIVKANCAVRPEEIMKVMEHPEEAWLLVVAACGRREPTGSATERTTGSSSAAEASAASTTRLDPEEAPKDDGWERFCQEGIPWCLHYRAIGFPAGFRICDAIEPLPDAEDAEGVIPDAGGAIPDAEDAGGEIPSAEHVDGSRRSSEWRSWV